MTEHYCRCGTGVAAFFYDEATAQGFVDTPDGKVRFSAPSLPKAAARAEEIAVKAAEEWHLNAPLVAR